jgi:hypothetical protein
MNIMDPMLSVYWGIKILLVIFLARSLCDAKEKNNCAAECKGFLYEHHILNCCLTVRTKCGFSTSELFADKCLYFCKNLLCLTILFRKKAFA